MTNTEYIKIAWSDVQPGDILMHENGDRLTVQAALPHGYPTVLDTADYTRAVQNYRDAGFTPHRKVEPVPTEPGAYLDKDGRLCVLTDGATYDLDRWYIVDNNVLLTSDGIRSFAPFTRLVPMPTGDQVRDAIQSQIGKHSNLVDDAAAAVMALLSGEANSTEVES